ncbi:hypothetical protein [Leptospira stimsonii]|uniref:Uncharacterized protein n=1 Tax=Leptospira stimsonii TaxID=2202203 RepID=A0A8B3CME3_9LEPT|nr:hypothetical protein [Leptospira stimsonii]RHX83777.1 hypothetical protein DLM78_19990 [Leptospira stimsonii]
MWTYRFLGKNGVSISVIVRILEKNNPFIPITESDVGKLWETLQTWIGYIKRMILFQRYKYRSKENLTKERKNL